MSQPYRLLVHAGVGNLSPDSDLAEVEHEVRSALSRSLEVGDRILKRGGSSVEAVAQAVVVLEDCPLFNAGRGSVLTRVGTVEMDAAIIDGALGRGGAVACVRTVRNPVLAARAVMEAASAELLCAEGADAFAAGAGCATEPQTYFITDYWRRRWETLKDTGPELDHSARGADKHGTVGAVAVDQEGNPSAATSTGGLLNKAPGRIGDSALCGAGTYANAEIAVSLTGTGEQIIRAVAAHRLAMLVERGLILQAAAQAVLRTVDAAGGEAGLIAVDRAGSVAIVFNTTHMLRGWIDEDGVPRTAIGVDADH